MRVRPKTEAQRQAQFWAQVDKSTGLGPHGDCWEWRGALSSGGYGRLSYCGRNVSAHRLAYAWEVGALTKDASHHGLCVLHRCDNRVCVRPDHLWVGTHAENMSDRDAKGRGAIPDNRGERCGAARLTWPQVRAIRAFDWRGVLTHQELATFFGLRSNVSIHLILKHKQWKECQ